MKMIMQPGRLAKSAIFILLFCQTPLLAAGVESAFSDTWQMIGKIFNIILLLGILIYFLRKPIRQFITGRTASIQQRIEAAERAKDEALQKLKEIEERLRKLDEESAAIREQAQRDAEAEREMMLKKTREEVEKMRCRAQAEIESLRMQAVAELRQFTAEKVVAMAEEIIIKEVQPNEEERLFDDFLDKMGEKR